MLIVPLWFFILTKSCFHHFLILILSSNPLHKDFGYTQFILEEDTEDIELMELEFGKDGKPLMIQGGPGWDEDDQRDEEDEDEDYDGEEFDREVDHNTRQFNSLD